MSRYGKRSFRCPECWQGYNSESTVTNHRRRSQGECIMYKPADAVRIAKYRRTNNIAVALPLPEPREKT